MPPSVSIDAGRRWMEHGIEDHADDGCAVAGVENRIRVDPAVHGTAGDPGQAAVFRPVCLVPASARWL